MIARGNFRRLMVFYRICLWLNSISFFTEPDLPISQTKSVAGTMYNCENARGWGVIRSRKLSTWIIAVSELWWWGKYRTFKVFGGRWIGMSKFEHMQTWASLPTRPLLAMRPWQVSTFWTTVSGQVWTYVPPKKEFYYQIHLGNTGLNKFK